MEPETEQFEAKITNVGGSDGIIIKQKHLYKIGAKRGERLQVLIRRMPEIIDDEPAKATYWYRSFHGETSRPAPICN